MDHAYYESSYYQANSSQDTVGMAVLSIYLIILALVLISGAYRFSYEKAKERSLEEQKTETKQEQAVAAEGEASKEEGYYLVDINGYIVVYLSDKKTIYEYTDILVDELPVSVQTEIETGKYVEDIQTLYGFLENYSS